MRLILLLAGLSSGCVTAVAEPIPSGAASTVTAYSSAFNANDCEGLLSLMSPSQQRDGGTAYCKILEEFHSGGVRDRLRAPTASLASGEYRMVVFPTTRFGFDPAGPSLTDGVYIVHSSDAGKTWRVLDLGCVDAAWVKTVYPPYGGAPRIGPAQLTVLSNLH